MTGKILVVEGLDLTGKSTITSKLHSMVDNSVVIHNPTGYEPFTHDVYSLIKKHYDNIPSESLNMLMAVTHKHNIEQMNDLKDSGKVVIADRSILSFRAYQNINDDEYFKMQEMLKIPRLDVDRYVYAFCDEQTHEQRIKQRNGNFDAIERFMFNNKDLLEKRYAYLLKNSVAPVTYINTSTDVHIDFYTNLRDSLLNG